MCWWYGGDDNEGGISDGGSDKGESGGGCSDGDNKKCHCQMWEIYVF